MDTSDSEHFESADEDIEDEDQDSNNRNKKFISLETNISKKITKLNLPDERMKETTSESTVKDSERSKITKEIHEEFNTESTELSVPSAQSADNQTNTNKGSIEKKNLVQHKDYHKYEIGNEKKIMDKKCKDSRSQTSIVKDNMVVDEAKSGKNENEEEDNLWADDELDWEAEGKLNTKDVLFHEEQASKPEVSNRAISKPSEESNTQNNQDSWGAWSSWGVSVLSTATQSVSSITTQLTNAIESGLGAVDPEELAKINAEEKNKNVDVKNVEETYSECPETSSAGFGIGNLVKFVENTGTKVISGGLDTLETIGKRTMEVLQEGDPGLRKKRAFLKIDQGRPVLSQILREAKERGEREDTVERNFRRKTKTYETLFDDYHGLVHLEALELLSKQCEIKLNNIQNSLNGEEYTKFLKSMELIKSLCEINELYVEPDDLEEVDANLVMCITEAGVPEISYDKLIEFSKESEVWLNELKIEECDENELHQKAIEILAQITAMAVERFHKIGEFLLIKDKKDRCTEDEATRLEILTSTLTTLIEIMAARFSEKLNLKNTNNENKKVAELITNVFFEAGNSSSYVQDAFMLLVPVIQVGEV